MDALEDETTVDSADEEQTALIDQLSVLAQSRLGSVLRDKLRLDTLLGVGGMAAVYAATHRNGSRVAVKMLHPEMASNPDVRSRFLREGYVANAVGHDGVVKVIDDDTAADGTVFLVMELLDGETLEERRLRFGGRLSEDEVLCVTDQILDVLIAAHARSIVHRDLKCENIFLTRAGVAKILDFGIARLREVSRASTATRTGTAMGTPAFMPPEQARGLWDEVDGRSDLWAVGATMFNLLTGQLIHEGRTPNEQLLSAMTKPAPALASVLPGTGRTVAHAVDRALAFEKENRWPNAQRMQEAVRHAYHDRHGAPISTAPRLLVPDSVPNRTLPSVAAVSNPLAPRLPTTGQPVFQSHASNGSARSRVPRALLVAIAAGAAAGVVVTGVLVVSNRTASNDTAASVSPVVEAPPPSAIVSAMPAPELAAPVPPTIAVTALPVAPAATKAPSPTPTGSAAPRPAAAPPMQTLASTKAQTPTAARPPTGLAESPYRAANPIALEPPPPGPASPPVTPPRPGCDPPFITVGGKKKWKEECL